MGAESVADHQPRRPYQELINWLRLNHIYDFFKPRRKLAARYSMVVPCYNVEKYIDTFFASVFTQDVDPGNLEIIAVDDGSSDGTAARIRYWMKRFPATIQYVRQENMGLAEARNTGLARATGDWVSFPDPDDFLSRNYLDEVDAEISSAGPNLSIVSCNFVVFREESASLEDSHPLRYRFKKRRTSLPASNLGDHIQISVNSAWLRRSLIDSSELNFDRRVAPTFEDGHFTNRLLLLHPCAEVTFLKAPVYHYRKREDASSLIDTAKLSKEWFLQAPRYGYLDLLEFAKDTAGEIPRFIQRTVLYSVFGRFRYLVGHPERAAHLEPYEREEFVALLKEIFCHIETATIETFELAKCTEEHRVGLLALLKNAERAVTTLYVRDFDADEELVQFSYCSHDAKPHVTARVNGRSASLRSPGCRKVSFLNHTYYYEHSFWIPMAYGDNVVVQVDGQPSAIKSGARYVGVMCRREVLRGALR